MIDKSLMDKVDKLRAEKGMVTFSGRESGMSRKELRLLERRGILNKEMMSEGHTIYYLYNFTLRAEV